MTKTFTCKELGGVCDKEFSGETFDKIMKKAAEHMMSDETHKQKIMSMGNGSETKDHWMKRMQKEFDSKPFSNI